MQQNEDLDDMIEDFGRLGIYSNRIEAIQINDSQMDEECKLLQQVDFQLTTSRFYLQDNQEQNILEAEDGDSFEQLSLDEEISNNQSINQIREFDVCPSKDDDYESSTILHEQKHQQLQVYDSDQSTNMPLQSQKYDEIDTQEENMADEINNAVIIIPIEQPKLLTSTIFNMARKAEPINTIISQKSTRTQKLFEIHRQYQSLKEGYIHKKSNGLLGGFDKRYFILTNSKLFYFNCEKKLVARGVINFRVAVCNVLLQKDKQFTIYIDQNSTPYILRATTQKDAVEWSNLIESIIISNKCKRKAWVKTVNLQEYLDNDCITEEEFIDYAETGDILLFQTDNFASKLQRGLTSSKFGTYSSQQQLIDHVGMVIKFYNQELRVFDSNGGSGVTLLPWSEFVALNDLYVKISLRKLVYSRKAELDTKIFQFVGESLGKKYILNFRKLMKKESLPRKPNTAQKDEGYFCSELIAKTLKRCDLLDPIKASSQYWPVDFSQEKKIKLLKGATLSNEITIIVRDHRYI